MEEKIAFECYLCGDENEIFIHDIEFFIDRIVVLPKIRPHKLEKAVSLCIEYNHIDGFREKILDKIYNCPVLIYKLYKRGIFVFDDIIPFIQNGDTFLIFYYYQKEINDFQIFIKSKDKPYDFDESVLENANEIDQMIEYGFIPSSIEYCLKYDVIDDLQNFHLLDQDLKWSPFEWSIKPQYLDLLSFSGFFGSTKCFKHLLFKGF